MKYFLYYYLFGFICLIVYRLIDKDKHIGGFYIGAPLIWPLFALGLLVQILFDKEY